MVQVGKKVKAANEERIYPNSNVINFYIAVQIHMGDGEEVRDFNFIIKRSTTDFLKAWKQVSILIWQRCEFSFSLFHLIVECLSMRWNLKMYDCCRWKIKNALQCSIQAQSIFSLHTIDQNSSFTATLYERAVTLCCCVVKYWAPKTMKLIKHTCEVVVSIKVFFLFFHLHSLLKVFPSFRVSEVGYIAEFLLKREH